MKEDINMSKKLYGYVSKDNIEYQWKSEPTACEVCKSMNGKIYKSANDIPDRHIQIANAGLMFWKKNLLLTQ